LQARIESTIPQTAVTVQAYSGALGADHAAAAALAERGHRHIDCVASTLLSLFMTAEAGYVEGKNLAVG
jgi:hypothetical protein